eukprot:c34141_g1_i1 orf=278-565(+)
MKTCDDLEAPTWRNMQDPLPGRELKMAEAPRLHIGLQANGSHPQHSRQRSYRATEQMRSSMSNLLHNADPHNLMLLVGTNSMGYDVVGALQQNQI